MYEQQHFHLHEIVPTHFFSVLFLPFTCSFFSSACLRCKSNFKCLLFSRLDFVFKMLETKNLCLFLPCLSSYFIPSRRIPHPAVLHSFTLLCSVLPPPYPSFEYFLPSESYNLGLSAQMGRERSLFCPCS